MDNKSTTKRMIGAVVLVLVAALLLAWLLKGKTRQGDEQLAANDATNVEAQSEAQPISGFPGVQDENAQDAQQVADSGAAQQEQGATDDPAAPPALLADASDAVSETGAAAADSAAQAGTAVAEGAGEAVDAAADGAKQVADGATFAITPGETRGVVNPDGTIQEGTGSMGTNDVAVNGSDDKTAEGEQQQVADASGTAETEAKDGDAANAQQVADASTATQEKADGDAATQQADAKQAETEAEGDTKVADASKADDGSAAADADQAGQQQVAKADDKADKPAQKEAAKKPVIVAESAVPEKKSNKSSGGASKNATGSSQPRLVASSGNKASSGSSSNKRSSAANARSYVIQVLATSSKGKANGVRQSIARDGYPVFVSSASVNGKSIYRVQIGSYNAKNEAARVQATMKARYSKNEFVQNSFITNRK